MKDVDGRFGYRSPNYSDDSECRLRVYVKPNLEAVVIASELADNPGPSVTNTAEYWAQEAIKEYGLDPGRTTFVEHYDRRPGGSYRTDSAWRPEFPSDQEQTFDLLEFHWYKDGELFKASRPKWKHSTKENIEQLTGESLD